MLLDTAWMDQDHVNSIFSAILAALCGVADPLRSLLAEREQK